MADPRALEEGQHPLHPVLPGDPLLVADEVLEPPEGDKDPTAEAHRPGGGGEDEGRPNPFQIPAVVDDEEFLGGRLATGSGLRDGFAGRRGGLGSDGAHRNPSFLAQEEAVDATLAALLDELVAGGAAPGLEILHRPWIGGQDL